MNELRKIIPEKTHKFLNYANLEEIRFRQDKPLALRINGKIEVNKQILITLEEIRKIIQLATNYSFHTYAEYIKYGFITISGGHRIGICGNILIDEKKVLNFKEITSINIRIAKKNTKIDENILKTSLNSNTLIISPPNFGKTTLLREIIKYLSNLNNNISVIDERFEIAGNDFFDLGVCTDVLSGICKKDGAIMMLRTMSPEYIVLDEITENIEILQNIMNCGVKIIATIHSESINTLQKKSPEILKYFDNYIEISIKNNTRIYNKMEVSNG